MLSKEEEFAFNEEKLSKIDSLTNLHDAPVWHIKEGSDKIIVPVYQEAVELFYKNHGANIKSVPTPFKHGFPIDDPSQKM